LSLNQHPVEQMVASPTLLLSKSMKISKPLSTHSRRIFFATWSRAIFCLETSFQNFIVKRSAFA
jgi:hypothetical protein